MTGYVRCPREEMMGGVSVKKDGMGHGDGEVVLEARRGDV